jgi:hypothetical protein
MESANTRLQTAKYDASSWRSRRYAKSYRMLPASEQRDVRQGLSDADATERLRAAEWVEALRCCDVARRAAYAERQRIRDVALTTPEEVTP